MSRKTEFRPAGSSMANTIRQSIRMMAGSDVPNYTLLFLDPTKYNNRGETKNIVVPYIVLGRGQSCNVQYGDDYSTVSRQHCSIQVDEQGAILIHNPQATNPTLVNNRPVQGHTILQPGDEIQLSYEGPRIRFLMDQRQTKTSTMGFTRRMSMAIGQAMRPYRTALMILGLLLLGSLTYGIYSAFKIKNIETSHDAALVRLETTQDSLNAARTRLAELEKSGKGTKEDIDKLRREVSRMESRGSQQSSSGRSPSGTYGGGASCNESNVIRAIGQVEDNVYFIQVESFQLLTPDPYGVFEKEDQIQEYYYSWGGTGFLLADGNFVTARHVVEPWKYLSSECAIEDLINDLLLRGGKVDITYSATSSTTGHRFTFTNKNIVTDESRDMITPVYRCFDNELKCKVARDPSTDWAYIYLGNSKSNLILGKEESASLQRGEKLYLLGYPKGKLLQSGESNGKLDPLYSEATVAQSGIVNNLINVTQNSITSGNSGGPVFVCRNGRMVVIGLVSARTGEIGVIVPASSLWLR